MSKEIIEGNVLIAKFMGWKDSVYENLPDKLYRKNDLGREVGVNKHQLMYDSDWNSLMPVVEKIESLIPKVFFNISGNEANIIIHSQDEIREPLFEHADNGNTKIEATYKTVVAFIQWYNSQTNNP